MVLVRPSRYTYSLIEETGVFSVNVPTPEMKELVKVCGTRSGRELDKLAGVINKYDQTVVHVVGHTDSVGSDAYNQGLSERRANAVKDYLTSQGVKASHLTARGYGEDRPRFPNDVEANRAKNRRAELVPMN